MIRFEEREKEVLSAGSMPKTARSNVSRGSEKPPPAKPWKKPSYETPMAFARFALELVNHPLGIEQQELEQRLGVGPRAIERYLAAWEEYRKAGFPRRVRGQAAHGREATLRRIRWPDQPRIETVTYENHHGEKRRWIRFAVKRNATDATAYEIASLAFMLTLLPEGLRHRMRESISSAPLTDVLGRQRLLVDVIDNPVRRGCSACRW